MGPVAVVSGSSPPPRRRLTLRLPFAAPPAGRSAVCCSPPREHAQNERRSPPLGDSERMAPHAAPGIGNMQTSGRANTHTHTEGTTAIADNTQARVRARCGRYRNARICGVHMNAVAHVGASRGAPGWPGDGDGAAISASKDRNAATCGTRARHGRQPLRNPHGRGRAHGGVAAAVRASRVRTDVHTRQQGPRVPTDVHTHQQVPSSTLHCAGSGQVSICRPP